MSPIQAATAAPAKPIEIAKSKAELVQDELAVAGAELHLTNTALERSLPATHKHGEVRKALDHSGKIEEKVVQAAEELAEVTDLLDEEIAQRHLLEQELARRPPAGRFAG